MGTHVSLNIPVRKGAGSNPADDITFCYTEHEEECGTPTGGGQDFLRHAFRARDGETRARRLIVWIFFVLGFFCSFCF